MRLAWTRLRSALDPIVNRVSRYWSQPLTSAEYVGSLPLAVDDARQHLKRQAYEPQYLSAATHPESGQLHDLSYRRVPRTHPDAAIGTTLAERFDPNECQYHCHGFLTTHGFDVFSHYETRPDLLRPRPSLERLNEHYRPTDDDTYLRGVTDLDL